MPWKCYSAEVRMHATYQLLFFPHLSSASSLSDRPIFSAIGLEDLAIELILTPLNFFQYINSLFSLLIFSECVWPTRCQNWRNWPWFFHHRFYLPIDLRNFAQWHSWIWVFQVWEISRITFLILKSLWNQRVELRLVTVMSACKLFIFYILLLHLSPVTFRHWDLGLCCHDFCVDPLIGFVDFLKL